MARDPFLLHSNAPLAIAPAAPVIAHVQLRDLLICPREQGVVNYVVAKGIAEQDMHAPGAPTRILSKLGFTPNSLTSLPVGVDDTLIAAGGQDRELHLSYYTPSSSSGTSSTSASRPRPPRTRRAWAYEERLIGSINNSVLLTSLGLTGSHQSSVEPRVMISNNDWSIRMYDIPMRVQTARRQLKQIGELKLDVAINHSSISPDGRTLISVGDSSKIYIHRLTGGAHVSFAPIHTLAIPPPEHSPLSAFHSASLAAAFSTAFSGDGSKFAVASQEGVVAVWDVRSSKAMRVWQTDKTRGMGGGAGGERGAGNGGATGWLTDDPWDWTRGTKAPGWCVRSVKFNRGGGGQDGQGGHGVYGVHVVDARTFETHDIVPVPTLFNPPPAPASRLQAQSHSYNTNTSRSQSQSQRRTVGMRARTTAHPTTTTTPSPSSAAAQANAERERERGLGNADTGSGTASMAGQSANPAVDVRLTTSRGLPVSHARVQTQRAGGVDAGGGVGADAGDGNPSGEIGASGGGGGIASGSGSTFASAPGPGQDRRTATSRSPAGAARERDAATLQQGIVQALGDTFRIPLPSSSLSSSSPAAAPLPSYLLARAYANPYPHPLARPGSHPHPHSHSHSYTPSHAHAHSHLPSPAHSPGRAASTTTTPSPPLMVRTNATSGRRTPASAPPPAPAPAQTHGTAMNTTANTTTTTTSPNAYSPPASIGDSTWRTLGGTGVGAGVWSLRMRDAVRGWLEDGSGSLPGSTTVTDLIARSPAAPGAAALNGGTGGRGVGGGDEDEDERMRDEEGSEEDVDVDEWALRQRAVRRARRRFRIAEEEDDEGSETEGETEAEAENTEGEGEEGEGEDLIVVPDLGDREVESSVHALLAVHGIESQLAGGDRRSGRRGRRSVVAEDEDEEDRMDVDVDDVGEGGEDEIVVDEEEDDDDEEEEEDEEDHYRLSGYADIVERARERVFQEQDEDDEQDDEDEHEDEDLDLDADCVSGESRSASPSVLHPGAGIRRRRGGIRQGANGGAASVSNNNNSSGGGTWTNGAIFGPSLRTGFNTASMSARYGSSGRSVTSASSSLSSEGGRGWAEEAAEEDTEGDGWSGVHYGGLGASASSLSLLTGTDTDKRIGGGAGTGPGGGGLTGRGGTGKEKGKGRGGRRYGYYEDLDIAGLCFDPWGEKMYVLGVGAAGQGAGAGAGAGVGGYGYGWGYGWGSGNGGGASGEGGGIGAVVEWSVRGAEKRWWVDEGWM